jgi:plasmid stabilization system protein ParE
VSVVIVLRAAQADLRRAAQFYEAEAVGLGSEFLGEVEQAYQLLSAHPEVGSGLRRGARRLLIRRFPFALIYRVEPERVVILAAGHQRRHPDFWLGRK